MKFLLNDKEQWFYITTQKGYEKAIGHEMEIGKYRFAALPMNDPKRGLVISITEVTSGYRLTHFPVNNLMEDVAATKEGFMSTLVLVADFTKRFIEKIGEEKIDKSLEDNIKKAAEKFGPMPKISENEEVDELTKKESQW